MHTGAGPGAGHQSQKGLIVKQNLLCEGKSSIQNQRIHIREKIYENNDQKVPLAAVHLLQQKSGRLNQRWVYNVQVRPSLRQNHSLSGDSYGEKPYQCKKCGKSFCQKTGIFSIRKFPQKPTGKKKCRQGIIKLQLIEHYRSMS